MKTLFVHHRGRTIGTVELNGFTRHDLDAAVLRAKHVADDYLSATWTTVEVFDNGRLAFQVFNPNMERAK